MSTVACIIARTNSTRLPKKVLKELNNKKMIEHIIDKIKRVNNVDEIYLCTSEDSEDKILLDIAEDNNIKSYAGSRAAVIERMLHVAEKEYATNVVRITGDNIFTDEIFLEKMIEEHVKNDMEYTRTEYLPIGITAEVMNVKALKRCYDLIDPDKSEYLFIYMFDPDKYKCQVIIPPIEFRYPYSSLTVDTTEDWERTMFIFNNLETNSIYYDKILELNRLTKIPYFEINSDIKIRLPDNESISYYNFREIIEDRIKKSNKVYLGSDYYENRKSKQ